MGFHAVGDPAFMPQFYQHCPDFKPLVFDADGNMILSEIPSLPPSSYASAKEASSDEQNIESFGVTEAQIKFRRRFCFGQRERKHAIAIVHPETKEVLLPGKAKITKEEEEFKRQAELEADRMNQAFHEKQKLRLEALNRKSPSC